MPLKLSIASSRKIGERNYGSRGATVGLEMEVDSSLVEHPRQLHERIRRLFRLAKQSVDLELNGSQCVASPNNGRESAIRFATERQVRAIHAIAGRLNMDLVRKLQEGFGVGRPEELTVDEASRLIDGLNSPDVSDSEDQSP
jgi:hypothetical protein